MNNKLGLDCFWGGAILILGTVLFGILTRENPESDRLIGNLILLGVILMFAGAVLMVIHQ